MILCGEKEVGEAEGKRERLSRLTLVIHTYNTQTKQNGRIAEQGDHAVLKAANGVYAKLLKTYKDSIIDV